jgi:hypothetical protein
MPSIMIDYATLCRAIEDWKAGQQPAAIKPPPPKRVPTRVVEDEEAVEYSAVYEIGEPAREEAGDSTVIYQLPDFESEGDAEVEVADDER